MGKGLQAVGVWLGVLAIASPAPAAPDDAARRQANTLSATGKAAYRDGRFDDAIIAFKAAYKTDPQPNHLYNLGMAYTKKGDDDRAIDALQRYLAEAPGAEDVDKVAAAMAFLRTRLEETRVELTVDSEPSGAALRLTGEDTDVRGATPYYGWHSPGAYELTLEADERVTDKRRIVLTLGKASALEVELEATPAPAPEPPPEQPREVLAPPTQAAAPAPAAKGPSIWPTAAWTTAGIALLSAGVFGLIAHGKADQLEVYDSEKQAPGRTREGATQLRDSVELFGAAATGSLVLAGVAAATGVVLTW